MNEIIAIQKERKIRRAQKAFKVKILINNYTIYFKVLNK